MGKFATDADVSGRFEGEIPPERAAWVNLRIEDVEGELMGLVPSLTADVESIEPERLKRVIRLVCDKVLELYRNPDGAATVQATSTMGPLTETESRYRSKNTVPGIAFTDAELRSVRLPKVRKARAIGSVPVAPWGVG